MQTNTSAGHFVVDDLKKVYQHKTLPLTTIVCLAIIIGLLGNILIIIVHKRRKSHERENRFFIYIIAWVDTCVLIIAFVSYIIDYRYHYDYPSTELCKIKKSVTYYASLTSFGIQCLISIQRYRMVFVPHKWQVTRFRKKISLILILVVSSAFSVPALVYFTRKKIEVEMGHVTCYQCALSDYWISQVRILQKFIGAVLFGSVAVTVILYSLVGYKIIKIMKQKTIMQMVQGNVQGPNAENSGNDTEPRCASRLRIQTTLRRRNKIRFSIMFILIAFVGMVSSIPTGIIVAISRENDTFLEGLSFESFQLIIFLKSSYLIAPIVNPVIYGFFDRTFLYYIKMLFHKYCK